MTRENTPNIGEVRISPRDLSNLPAFIGRKIKPMSQVLYAYLKRRGAPIKGHITLKYDPEYAFTEWHDPQTGDYIIRWRKV